MGRREAKIPGTRRDGERDGTADGNHHTKYTDTIKANYLEGPRHTWTRPHASGAHKQVADSEAAIPSTTDARYRDIKHRHVACISTICKLEGEGDTTKRTSS